MRSVHEPHYACVYDCVHDCECAYGYEHDHWNVHDHGYGMLCVCDGVYVLQDDHGGEYDDFNLDGNFCNLVERSLIHLEFCVEYSFLVHGMVFISVLP